MSVAGKCLSTYNFALKLVSLRLPFFYFTVDVKVTLPRQRGSSNLPSLSNVIQGIRPSEWCHDSVKDNKRQANTTQSYANA